MIHQTIAYVTDVPDRGGFVEIAPGVRWIRLPLPFRLDHINVWALDDGDGWTVVDTGVRTDEVAGVWEKLASQPPLDRPLKRVLVTHMHPDHIGMAGWLTRKHSVKLWASRLEYLACRVVVADGGREAPADAVRFYQEAGWSPAALDAYRARFGNFGQLIYALPDSYRRLDDGDIVGIGGRRWEVVTGNGHSPEHVCLYCEALKLLISGDQVLPKISSNVSVHPMEPEANPMADWYASLDKVQRRVPDDVLVLPAHNDCFHGLHARIRQLREGQDAAMDRLRDSLSEPRRVVDVFVALFRRAIQESDGPLLGMATGEAIACLNYLIDAGEATREIRDGVGWYRSN